MRYIVTEPIDRWEVGTDVTGKYLPNVADRLVDEGFLMVADDDGHELPKVEEQPKRRSRKTVEHFVDDEPAQD